MLNNSCELGNLQSVSEPKIKLEQYVVAFSMVISPPSDFCHINPVMVSVTVPFPLSIKKGVLIE